LYSNNNHEKGWGTLKEGGDVSQTLQAVTVPIMSNSACKKTKYSERRITDNMMCGKKNNKIGLKFLFNFNFFCSWIQRRVT
jgi:Trypsin